MAGLKNCEANMRKALQHRGPISRISRRAANGLALAVVLVPFILSQVVQAQTYTILYSFNDSSGGQAFPWGPLVEANGTLYGTTSTSEVFSVNASNGVETVLYTFKGGTDGLYPFSGVIRDLGGNLYGTTSMGGTSNRGTIFKLDSSNTETVLHSFGSGARSPYGGLTLDANGNLYGTTTYGGTFHDGIVFKFGKNGRYTVLYNFKGGTDGFYPFYENLILDKTGDLYGTTVSGGGTTTCNGPCGTVFRLNIKTHLETVLYRFTGGTDGANPYAGLIRDANGNLYGATHNGGVSQGCGGASCGTVFKLDKAGKETVLYSFQGTDGAYPQGSLILDAQGNLYGTTFRGGTYGYGTVFKLNTNGVETVLHSFNGDDGEYPTSSLVQDAAGNLYGTTSEGGTAGCGGPPEGCGVIFKITP